MTEVKTIQSISYGTLNFSIYERQGQFGPQKSFVLSKRVYNKETRNFDKVGNVQLKNFADLSTIKVLLRNYEKGKTINSYSLYQYAETGIYIFSKEYQNKEGAKEFQKINLETQEVYQLIDLIDRVLALNIKPISVNKKEEKETPITAEYINNFLSEKKQEKDNDFIDDEIPF